MRKVGTRRTVYHTSVLSFLSFPVLWGWALESLHPPTPVSSQTRFLRESVVELVLLCMPPAMAMVRGSGKACLLFFPFSQELSEFLVLPWPKVNAPLWLNSFVTVSGEPVRPRYPNPALC